MYDTYPAYLDQGRIQTVSTVSGPDRRWIQTRYTGYVSGLRPDTEQIQCINTYPHRIVHLGAQLKTPVQLNRPIYDLRPISNLTKDTYKSNTKVTADLLQSKPLDTFKSINLGTHTAYDTVGLETAFTSKTQASRAM